MPREYKNLAGCKIYGLDGKTTVNLNGNGGNGYHWTFSSNHTKVKIININFEWNGKNNMKGILSIGNKNDWDTDSTVKGCAFSCNSGGKVESNNGEYTAAVRYFGRNLKLEGCSFSKKNGTCVLIVGTPRGDGEEGQDYKNGAQGFRKFSLTGNRIHVADRFLAVINDNYKGSKEPYLRGMLLSDNECDTGSQLLFIANDAGITDSTITGNTCIGDYGSSKKKFSDYDSYIHAKGEFNRNTIVGNVLQGWSDDYEDRDNKNADGPDYAIRFGSKTHANVINGNVLGFTNKHIIYFEAGVKGTVISGNAFSVAGVTKIAPLQQGR